MDTPADDAAARPRVLAGGQDATAPDITGHKRTEETLRQSEHRYRDVVEALHDGVLVHSRTELETVNQAAIDLWGYTFEELCDPATFEAMDPINPDGTPIPFEDRAPIRAMRTSQPVFGLVTGLLIPGRGRRWFNVNARPRLSGHEVIGAVVTISDITDRKQAEDALRESENRFRTLAESLSVGIFHASVEGKIDYANPRWLEITDIETDHFNDEANLERVHPDDRTPMWLQITDAFKHHEPYHVQYRIRRRDGSIRWLSGRGSRTYDLETGDPTGMVGSIQDITPLVEALQVTERLAGIVESTSDLVGVIDYRSGKLTYLNHASRELFGYIDQDVSELHFLELLTGDGAELARDSLLPRLQRDEVWSGELEMRAHDGSIRLVAQTIAAERDENHDIFQLSSVGRDVTERRRVEENLAWQATHDTHTGLPNRALLLDHLELALARTERDGGMAALLFLDLDRFKLVNDTYGHDAGDALLVQTAARLSEVLRPNDTVARLGGDEFVVLAEEVEDEQHAVAIAQRLASAIDSRPFDVKDQALDVTVSIGIAVARGREAHPEALLRDADAAMYRAKDLGRARLELFNEAMRQTAARRNELAEELARGIEHDEIVAYYQPCIDLDSGRVTGVEALARWHHPDRGVLLPYEFITLAEDSGLIIGLGLSVLSKACHQAKQWQERFGPSSPVVHVNLSARQLMARNLPTLVEGVLDGTGLHAQKLCLEITESVLMDDAPAVIDTLWALKGIGVSIAIDDFGTGYSSLSYLRKFPVDVLKVDQSFVDGLGPDPEDSAIVAAIVNLAATLDLDAIAEGVETPAQVQRLRSLGCRTGQGFLFSEPLPPGEVEATFDKTFDVGP